MNKKEPTLTLPIVISSIVVGVIFLQILGVDIAGLIRNLYQMKYLPELHHDASFIAIFTLGLLTSFHCVGMCGGILLSQSTPFQNDSCKSNTLSRVGIIPLIVYNCGRIISYTIIGGIVGGIGKAVTPKGYTSGILVAAGGVFLIIMGINLLGKYPFLRRLNISMPKFIGKKLFNGKQQAPFIVGILSGLLPCGPLQIAQLYALGTRSVIAGAVSMLIFALGTVPLLFSFGALHFLINKRYTIVFTKISAVLIIILGCSMIARGTLLSGVNLTTLSLPVSDCKDRIAKIDGNIQIGYTEVQPHDFGTVTVKRGIPVRLNLHVTDNNLNHCNNKVVIPALKIEQTIQVGDNYVEFTPARAGKIQFTCWMGMCTGVIEIIE